MTGAVKPVLEMVGVSFEKQVMKAEKGGNFLSSERDFYAPSTPHSSPEKKVQSTISGAFLARNSKMKSSGDSSIGRLLASSVLRKGISENLSESSQLNVLRELTAACTCSVNSSTDGTDATRSTNVESTSLNRHQIQVALTEISHLVVAVGEAGASSLEDILTMVENCLSHSDHGVRYEAAIVYAAIAQAFPAEGRKFVINSLSGVIAKLDEIQHLSQVVASISSPAPKSRFRRTVPLEKSGSVDELMKSQCILHGNALAVSMLMHEFPHIMGGVAAVIVGKVFEVSGKLLDCQFNESFVKASRTSSQ